MDRVGQLAYIILILRSLGQEDHKFQASLSYITLSLKRGKLEVWLRKELSRKEVQGRLIEYGQGLPFSGDPDGREV